MRWHCRRCQQKPLGVSAPQLAFGNWFASIDSWYLVWRNRFWYLVCFNWLLVFGLLQLAVGIWVGAIVFGIWFGALGFGILFAASIGFWYLVRFNRLLVFFCFNWLLVFGLLQLDFGIWFGAIDIWQLAIGLPQPLLLSFYISMLRVEYRLGLTQKYPLLWMRIELSHNS